MRVVFLLIGAVTFVCCCGAPAFSAAAPWTIELSNCPENAEADRCLEAQLPFSLPLTDYHWVEAVLDCLGPRWSLSDLRWHFEGNDALEELSLVHGGPHITSKDPYRILHRGRYGRDSLALYGRSGSYHAAVGRKIPARDDVNMYMAYLHRSAAALEYGMLGYRAPWQWASECYQSRHGLVGSSRWLLEGEHWAWQVASSLHLSYSDIAGYVRRKAVLGTAALLEWETAATGGEIEFLISPQGLHSPLGGSFPIPEDRVGMRSSTYVHGDGWTLGLDASELTSYDGTRRYIRRWWELKWGEDPALELSLRRQPTANFIGILSAGSHTWRWDHARQQFRWDVSFPQAQLRFDALADGRLRLEWRYRAGLKPHVIGKYNRVTGERDVYAATSLGWGSWELQVSVGTYDRGRVLRNWPEHNRWNIQAAYHF